VELSILQGERGESMAECDSNVCAIINTMVHVRYDADIVVFRCCSMYYVQCRTRNRKKTVERK